MPFSSAVGVDAPRVLVCLLPFQQVARGILCIEVLNVSGKLPDEVGPGRPHRHDQRFSGDWSRTFYFDVHLEHVSVRPGHSDRESDVNWRLSQTDLSKTGQTT